MFYFCFYIVVVLIIATLETPSFQGNFQHENSTGECVKFFPCAFAQLWLCASCSHNCLHQICPQWSMHGDIKIGLLECAQPGAVLENGLEVAVSAEHGSSCGYWKSVVWLMPLHWQLHCLLVHFWAQFKVFIMTYKALNGLRPAYSIWEITFLHRSGPFMEVVWGYPAGCAAPKRS